MADDPLVPITRAPVVDVPRVGTPLSESISVAVQRALDAMEPGQRGTVNVNVSLSGVDAHIAVRVKDLEAGAYVLHEWDGDTEAGGRITWRW